MEDVRNQDEQQPAGTPGGDDQSNDGDQSTPGSDDQSMPGSDESAAPSTDEGDDDNAGGDEGSDN